MSYEAGSDNQTTAMVQHVDPKTGEIAVFDAADGTPLDLRTQTYAGFSEMPASESAQAILMAAVQEDEVDILPTGELYISHAKYRQRLTQAFGPLAWGMRPLGNHTMDTGTMFREWGLYGGGRLAAVAVGSADYHESNDRMSYADAAEAVKSNALSRCCKDLGIALDLWDRRWVERFKRANCIKVWRDKAGRNKSGEYQWRRKDADPFWDEKGQAQTQAPPASRPAAATNPPAATTGQGQPQAAQATTSAPPAAQTSTAVPTAQAAQPTGQDGDTLHPVANVVSVDQIRTGKRQNGTDWVLSAITLEGNQTPFETLSADVATLARKLMTDGVPASITSRAKADARGKVHHDIVKIVPAF